MLNSKYWTEYHNKKMTAEEALSHIKTGDVIGTSQCGVDPKTLLGKLHTITPKVTDLTMMCGMCVNEYPFMNDPTYKEHFTLDGIFFMGATGRPTSWACSARSRPISTTARGAGWRLTGPMCSSGRRPPWTTMAISVFPCV